MRVLRKISRLEFDPRTLPADIRSFPKALEKMSSLIADPAMRMQYRSYMTTAVEEEGGEELSRRKQRRRKKMGAFGFRVYSTSREPHPGPKTSMRRSVVYSGFDPQAFINLSQAWAKEGEGAFHVRYRFHAGLTTKRCKTICGLKIKKPVFRLRTDSGLAIPTNSIAVDMCEACWMQMTHQRRTPGHVREGHLYYEQVEDSLVVEDFDGLNVFFFTQPATHLSLHSLLRGGLTELLQQVPTDHLTHLNDPFPYSRGVKGKI